MDASDLCREGVRFAAHMNLIVLAYST